MYPPSLWLFAEGHEEAERRVPGVSRTWHFILQSCCPGSFLSQVWTHLSFEMINKTHSCYSQAVMQEKQKFKENVKLKGKVKAAL